MLDIDGVLNKYGPETFHPDCIAQLNRVLAATEASICVSSAWRHLLHDQDGARADMTASGFTTMLRTHGARGVRIVGFTDMDTDESTRGGLIRQWMKAHRARLGIDKYVVLDDEDDGISGESLVFVQTSSTTGLDAGAADDVIRLLNRE